MGGVQCGVKRGARVYVWMKARRGWRDGGREGGRVSSKDDTANGGGGEWGWGGGSMGSSRVMWYVRVFLVAMVPFSKLYFAFVLLSFFD